MGSLRRLKATVQYDGTDFLGFQRQKSGRTVQEVLESGLEALLQHKVTVRAAGRTDRGVHARGQVISFVTGSSIPTARIHRGLEKFLPGDVIVGECQEVPMSFDPLRDAVSKTYCYRIWRDDRLNGGNRCGLGGRDCGNRRHGDIMTARFSVAYPGDLDFDLMVAEARDLVGRHDFHNFRAQGSSSSTTVRRVYSAEWFQERSWKGEIWTFSISADGFLYKMVRLITGTLVDVGRGRFSPGKIREALASRSRIKVGTCLPGRGLCLEEVRFS
ncbi:MAG: tRNA pseudouridine(38-40) synthase TruA [Bacillota bacterium]|jgi:tRNA pseudouridine38-40 synthase